MSDTYNEKSDDKSKIRDRIISTTPIIHFGERLKEAMSGMTNVELARRTGMSEATIRKYTAGKMLPTIDSVAIVADACGVSFSWLAFGDELKGNNNPKPAVTKVLNDEGLDILEKEFYERAFRDSKLVITDINKITPEEELMNLVRALEKEEIEQVVNVLKRKGVELLTLLNDEISIELLQLPDHEKTQLLTHYKMTKEGAFEGDQRDAVIHPTQNQVG